MNNKPIKHYINKLGNLLKGMNVAGLLGNLKKWFTRHKYVNYVLIVIILLSLILFATFYLLGGSREYMDDRIAAEIEYLEEYRRLEFSDSLKDESENLQNRLQQQYDRIKDRALLHLDIAMTFLSAHYMSIIMATLSGIGAGVFLLIISKNGWKELDSYILTIFLTLAASTVFFSTLPATMKQKQNIDDNKIMYYAYAALENQILSYTASGSIEISDDVNGEIEITELKEFIHMIDKQLATYNQFPVELDPDAVPEVKDIMDKFGH